MNNDKDTFLPASSEDEALGRLLSGGLGQADTARSRGCPGPEAIATVVDGTADNDERDRVLKHVSACDDCYEMFLLTTELQKEEVARTGTHNVFHVFRWKPLALAASLLIVVFSLYVFYRSSEIPKTPGELMEKSDTFKVKIGVEEDAADVEGGVEGGVSAGVEGVVRSKTEASPVVPPPSKKREALKRERMDKEEEMTKAGEKTAAAPLDFAEQEAVTKTAEKDAPETESEIHEEEIAGKRISKKMTPKKPMPKIGMLQKGIPAKKISKKEIEKKSRDVNTFALDGVNISTKEAKREKGKAGRDYKAKKQAQPRLKAVEKSRHMQKTDASKKMIQRQKIRVSETITATQSVERELNAAPVQTSVQQEQQAAPIQFQAQQLNVMLDGINSYLPGKELENLFKDSIVLSQQLGEEYETVRQNAVTTGDDSTVKSYEKGLKPLINVKTVGNKTYISPNIHWFYSRSEPTTVEHQFFALARAGWCAAASQCYKEDKPTRRLLDVETRMKGEFGNDKANRLLVRWQTLQPQLKGVFKEVAVNTITQLKTKDK